MVKLNGVTPSLLLFGDSLQANKFEAELAIGFQFVSEKYKSIVTLTPNERVQSVSNETRLFKLLESDWKFEPSLTPASSWVEFSVNWQFNNVLYSQLSQVFSEQVVLYMVRAYEGRCAALKNEPPKDIEYAEEPRTFARGHAVAVSTPIPKVSPQIQGKPSDIRPSLQSSYSFWH